MIKRLGVPVLLAGLAIFSVASHVVAATLDTVVRCRVIHNFDSESYIDQGGGSRPLPGAGVDGDWVAIHTDTAVLKRWYFDRYGDKVFLKFESGPLGAVVKGQSLLAPAVTGVRRQVQPVLSGGLVPPLPIRQPTVAPPQQKNAQLQKRREENLERKEQRQAQRKEESIERKREQNGEHHKEVVEQKQSARRQRAEDKKETQKPRKAAAHPGHKARRPAPKPAPKRAPKPHGRHK